MEHPIVLERMLPSSDFRNLHLGKQRKEAVIKRSVTKNEVRRSKQRFQAQSFLFSLKHFCRGIQAVTGRERTLGFTMMKRDTAVYVRGEVRHPDHETMTLNGWHHALMNTENRSSALRYLAFLD
jgi:hypothetical protein